MCGSRLPNRLRAQHGVDLHRYDLRRNKNVTKQQQDEQVHPRESHGQNSLGGLPVVTFGFVCGRLTGHQGRPTILVTFAGAVNRRPCDRWSRRSRDSLRDPLLDLSEQELSQGLP